MDFSVYLKYPPEMVHELSLYGVLPEKEEHIFLSTLASWSGMQPREFQDHILVWEPTHPFRPKLAAGQVNQIEQYRIFARHSDAVCRPFSKHEAELAKEAWEISIHEVPEAGKALKLLSQTVLSTPVVEGDPFAYLSTLGYTYKSEYWIKGYEFVIKNVVLRIFRVLAASDGDIALVDPSKQYTVKAHVACKSVTDLPALEAATTELLAFQKDVKGLISIQLPDRQAFDTRVRARIPASS